MIMEILTGSGGGILSYLQDTLGGILSLSTKKSGGDSVRGGFCPTLDSFEICTDVFPFKLDIGTLGYILFHEVQTIIN